MEDWLRWVEGAGSQETGTCARFGGAPPPTGEAVRRTKAASVWGRAGALEMAAEEDYCEDYRRDGCAVVRDFVSAGETTYIAVIAMGAVESL